MKTTLIILAAIAMAAGCTNKKKQDTSPMPAANSGVLHVTTPSAPAAQYTPPPAPQAITHDPAPQDQPVIGAAQGAPIDESTYADASDGIAAPAPQRQVVRRTSAARPAQRSKTYKIKQGESLWSIAEARYGSGNKWKTIAAANPKINPDRVQAGQTIVLP